MRLRAGAAAGALLGVACVSLPAQGQAVSGRGSIMASGGYNAVVTPGSDTPSTNPMNGPLISLTPSGVLLVDTPQTSHTLNYSLSLTLPFSNELKFDVRRLQYANNFSYGGKFELTPLTALSLSVAVRENPNNGFVMGTDPSQSTVDVIPAGSSINLGFTGTEGITRQISESTSLTQSTAVTYGVPIDPILVKPRTLNVNNALSLSRRFDVDTLALSLAVGFSYFTAGESQTGVVSEPRRQFLNTLTGTWSRPLTPSLSGSVSLGLTQAVSPDSTAGQLIQPTGGATLNYSLDLAAISLSYAHAAMLSVFNASINMSDQVSLRVSAPIGTTGLSVSGSSGFLHSSPIASDGALQSPSNNVTGDVGLTYTPARAPQLSLGLRGQIQRQFQTENPLGNILRYGGTFSVTYSFPSARAAVTPPHFTSAFSPAPMIETDVVAPARRESEPLLGPSAPAEEPATPGP